MYNILCIIQNFPTLHSEKHISNIYKLNKTTIQNKKEIEK